MGVLLIILLFTTESVVCDSPDLHVEIQEGKLLGGILKTVEGRKFIGFQGIPYAEPPIGELRFKSPVPKKPWPQERDATRSHAVCLQKDHFFNGEIEGSEDCLFLNVYKPILKEMESTLPVMVYFHGGGFLSGSGNLEWYNPDILLDQDIVLVTVNYRLGPLGFLSTGDEVAPGNYGLKDQSLALKWVQRNIRSFNGDPNSVTIFGQSAGGASVHLHMLSPLSKGLFHRGISQSGTGFNVWAIASIEESIKNTQKLAKNVNCSRSTNQELIECLRSTDPVRYLKTDLFTEWNKVPMMPFRAVVEPASSGGFLVENIEKTIDARNFQEIPWMVGFTKDEGLFLSIDLVIKPKLIDQLNKDFTKMDKFFSFTDAIWDLDLVREEMKKFYFGNRNITTDHDFKILTDMLTDVAMSSSIDLAVRKHLKKSRAPIYSYLFAYEAGVSLSQVFGKTNLKGVGHCDDLRYLFSTVHKVPLYKNVTEEDKEVKNLLTSLWVNFAREGNPTPENFNPEIERWEPTTSNDVEYYLIDGPRPKMKSIWMGERMVFWRNLTSKSRRTS